MSKDLFLYFKQFEEVGFIPSEELNSVILLAQNGDKKALNNLVSSFQYFIYHVAKKMGVLSPNGYYAEDIISSGNIGLITAIKNFDTSIGSLFTSYAELNIKSAICEYLNKNHQIKYSKKAIQDLNRLYKAKKEEEAESELSKITGLSQKRVNELQYFNYSFVSLYNKNNETGEEYNVCDTEGVYSYDVPDSNFTQKEMQQCLYQALSSLDSREYFVVTKYFGIGCKSLDYQKIGDLLHLSKQRIQQICKGALIKLRKSDSKYNISAFLAA